MQCVQMPKSQLTLNKKENNMSADFQKELEQLLNRHSQENASNTPDFILANYLNNCLDAFNVAVARREEWYGRTPKVAPIQLGRPTKGNFNV